MLIKEGGYYRRRDGVVMGPAKAKDHYFLFNGFSYRSDGRHNNLVECPLDIAAEVEVRPKLNLRAGGKYTTEKPDGTAGPAITIIESAWNADINKTLMPFRVLNDSDIFVTGHAECVQWSTGLYVARIVAEYQEPPPTPVARLKQALKDIAENAKAADLIRGVIAELEAKP